MEFGASHARSDAEVRVTYFGSPGSKDDLATLLHGIVLLTSHARSLLTVTLAGLTLDELRSLPGMDEDIVNAALGNLEIVGRLDRHQLLDLLGASHYSISYGPKRRLARFGFPSKIPESMAAGCPPIANLTSDLSKYLKDGSNAIICGEQRAESVAVALGRGIAFVADGRHTSMSHQARRTAEQQFEAKAWGPRLREWLSA